MSSETERTSSTIEAELAALPPILRDRAFHAVTATQFLGAFNDNLFKQLLLLFCVDLSLRNSEPSGDIYQTIALALFALPFILFSGFAGFVADRNVKRTLIIWCKVAEIFVMLAGAIAFYLNDIRALLIVLALMTTQSAFFGPPKYGILPEMFRGRDLPRINGIIAMTTFISIVLGQGAAGYLKEWLGDENLYLASCACVVTGAIGTLTAFGIRRTRIANPGMAFHPSCLAVHTDTWKLITQTDRLLLAVLIVSSMFWMVGAAIQPTINLFGKSQLDIGDARTTNLLICIALGICIGCVVSGKLSGQRVRFGFVRLGVAGIVTILIAYGILGLLGPDHDGASVKALSDSANTLETIGPIGPNRPFSPLEIAGYPAFFLLGIFSGFFVVPVQVFLQVKPPHGEKGRIIAAMNLFNFVGILFGAAIHQLATYFLPILGLSPAGEMVFCGILLAPVLLFRPNDAKLS